MFLEADVLDMGRSSKSGAYDSDFCRGAVPFGVELVGEGPKPSLARVFSLA